MVRIRKPVAPEFEIDALPLVVKTALCVHSTMDQWRCHVDEEEGRNCWEDKSDEVAREANVDHSIALKGGKGLPESPIVGFSRERGLFLAEACDV